MEGPKVNDGQWKELRALKKAHLEELKKAAAPFKPETEAVLLARLRKQVKAAVKTGRPKEERVVIGGYPFVKSDADLKTLQWMDISDLQLRGTHREGYLLCRVLTRPPNLSLLSSSLNLTLTLPIASPDGSAGLLRLHNYPLLPPSLGRPTSADIDAVFPAGTMLVVKEPTVRRDIGGDGEWVVWVEDENDLVKVEIGHDVLDEQEWVGGDGGAWEPKEVEKKELDEWKEEGNRAFASRRLLLAERLFTHGINQHTSSPSLHLLLLNRSQTYLRLERFSSALADADRVLALLAPTDTSLLEKAYLRKSKALYSLRRWSLALDSYKALLAISPTLTDAQQGVAACEARLKEASTGEYDIPSLYSQALSAPSNGIHPMPDVADYVGPVAVAPIADKGGGRGLIATRDIAPGEVLLAVRAVSLVSASDLPIGQTKLVLWNLEEMVIDTSNSLYYVHNVLYRLRDQPELKGKVGELYLGPRAEEKTPPSFDLHVPITTGTGASQKGMEEKKVTGLDVHRAIYYNASVPFRFVDVPKDGGDTIAYGSNESPAALFSESAQINHSCAWNAFHAFYASHQLTLSTTPIPSGSEILASYTPDLPHAFRTPRLAKFFPEPCDCPLCTSDRNSPTLGARPGVIVRVMNDPAPPGEGRAGRAELVQARERREKLTKELERTYAVPETWHAAAKEDAKGADRVDMFFAYQALRPVLLALARLPDSTPADWEAVLSNERLALEALGATLSEGQDGLASLPRYRHAEATRALLILAGGSQHVDGRKWGTKEGWVDEAHRVERICLGAGADRAFFLNRWKEVLRENGLDEMVLKV